MDAFTLILAVVVVILLLILIWAVYRSLQEKPASKTRGGPVVQAAALKMDDLLVIEGIGPKISEILQTAGINSFAELAATSVERLKIVLAENDIRMVDPSTWAEQARLAAAGDWNRLQTLQDGLKGGRRVKA